MVSGMPSIVNVDENNICNIVVENCAPYDVTLEWDNILGIMETEEEELVPLTDDFISSVCQDIHNRFPKVKRKRLSREEIKQRCHLQVPEEFQEQYLDILCKHQDALSIDKYDLGLAKNFKHKIHLKTQDPVYRKQFKITEAHHQFIEQTLDEWLKLGVVKRSNSLNSSPIFCVPKKQTQDLPELQRTEPECPHRQVLHEGDHRMHRQHWKSRLHHFYDIGSHIRILADAIGRGFTEADSLHHPRQGPVPLDHVTHGTTTVSGQLPTTHGRGTP